MEALAQPLEVAAPARRPDLEPAGERRAAARGRRRRAAAAAATPGPRARAAARRRRCRRRACRAAASRFASSGGRPGAPASRAAVSGAAIASPGGSTKARSRSMPGAEPGDALGRQRQRLDADHPQAVGADAAGRPRAAARPSSRPAAAPAQSSRASRPPSGASTAARRLAAGHRGRTGVAGARLGVQRLHAAPERGRRRQPDEQRRELDRVPPPVAEAARPAPALIRAARRAGAPPPPSRAASRAAVGHHQQRRARLGDEREHQVEHRVAGRLVEAAGRLVGEDQPRPRRPAPARSPPAAAARRTAARGSGRAARASPSRSRQRLDLPARSSRPASRAWNAEVAADVEARDQVELLEHQPDRAAPQRRTAGVAEPAEPRRRRRRPRRGRPRRARRRGAAACSCRCPIRRSAPGSRRARGRARRREHRQQPLRGRIALGDVDEAQDRLGHAPASSMSGPRRQRAPVAAAPILTDNGACPTPLPPSRARRSAPSPSPTRRRWCARSSPAPGSTPPAARAVVAGAAELVRRGARPLLADGDGGLPRRVRPLDRRGRRADVPRRGAAAGARRRDDRRADRRQDRAVELGRAPRPLDLEPGQRRDLGPADHRPGARRRPGPPAPRRCAA